jgi:dTDP-4-dehydrorhamnose 3,5-epimerase
MELLLGEHHGAKVLKIPPGVAHGYRVIQGPVHLFYITSQTYDPKDEGRIPHDDPSIGYDWTAWPEIT